MNNKQYAAARTGYNYKDRVINIWTRFEALKDKRF